jgi:hypothetical protein
MIKLGINDQEKITTFVNRGVNRCSLIINNLMAQGLTGAPDGSEITVSYSYINSFDEEYLGNGQSDRDNITGWYKNICKISVKNTSVYGDQNADYSLRYVENSNSLTLVIDVIEILEEKRNTGIFRNIIKKTIESAFEYGVQKVALEAAYLKGDGVTPLLGLDVWPKYGFTGEALVKDNISIEEQQFPTEINAVNQDPRARDWHISSRNPFILTFDTNPDSENWRMLNLYLNRKGDGELHIPTSRDLQCRDPIIFSEQQE